MKILKWGSRIIGLIIILALLVGVIAYFVNRGTIPPDSKDASWAIQTFSLDDMKIPSRVYYAEQVEIIDNTPTITTYWTYDGERYKKHKGIKEFPFDEYGQVEIIRR